MAIFNGFSHIHGILIAFLCFLMACEYSSGCRQNNMKLCFSLLNISGLKKCKYLGGYENLELYLPVGIFKQCRISFKMINI